MSIPSSEIILSPGEIAEMLSSDELPRLPWIVKETLREGRMKAGLSMIEFSKLVGIERTYLWQLETGHTLPSPDLVVRMLPHLTSLNFSFEVRTVLIGEAGKGVVVSETFSDPFEGIRKLRVGLPNQFRLIREG